VEGIVGFGGLGRALRLFPISRYGGEDQDYSRRQSLHGNYYRKKNRGEKERRRSNHLPDGL